ncbi:hypothetical protein PV405_34650 [Streptomyces sp. ME02-6979-3A]|uniref:hypothetical protein n=1 Tax=Streptomyces sp. ME02-6979-3A TaxID=3028673 RepID=UPI0029A1B091|nr:hypothetical protein [Streptomyces sp. ME02-6979-3A]MDX3329733.1 hypothetical protein [Streptomyces sp. ME02-6979-3A]
MDLDPEDTAAMRRENGGKDFRLFLRQQIANGQARKTQAPAVNPPKPPGYRVGAWPDGARPPDPPLSRHTDADWQHALGQFRLGAGHDNDPCHCGSCPTTTKGLR